METDNTAPIRLNGIIVMLTILILLLWMLDFVAVLQGRRIQDAYREAIAFDKQVADLEQATVRNRLHLRTFLVTGDTSEADLVNTGIKVVDPMISAMEEAISDNSERQALERIRSIEKDWAGTFALPLIAQRRLVDSGSVSVPELQITYLNVQKTKEEPINRLASIVSDRANATDRSARFARTALYAITLSGMVLTVLLGWRIARGARR